MLFQLRKRRSSKIVYIHLRLYINSNLSFRNIYKALSKFVHRSHAAIRVVGCKSIGLKDCFIIKSKLQNSLLMKKNCNRKGWLSQLIWPSIAIDSENKELLQQPYQKSKCVFYKRFLSSHQGRGMNLISSMVELGIFHKDNFYKTKKQLNTFPLF